MLPGALVVPAGVRVVGAGRQRTTLRIPADPATPLVTAFGAGWNKCPDGVHDVGAGNVVSRAVPGRRRVDGLAPLCHAHGPVRPAGHVEGDHDRASMAENRSGSTIFPTRATGTSFKWSRSATVQVSAGRHELVWKNKTGGGLGIDAFVFSRDPQFTPGDAPFPANNAKTVVVQGETCERYLVSGGRLPGVDRPVVWLSGDGASVAGRHPPRHAAEQRRRGRCQSGLSPLDPRLRGARRLRLRLRGPGVAQQRHPSGQRRGGDRDQQRVLGQRPC